MISKNKLGRLIFPAKTVKQVAVLPLVILDSEVTVLLLTSRRRGRWILPKGWPENGVSFNAAAMTEAMEEAGLAGEVAARAIGSYTYKKHMRGGYEITCHVSVYPMLVSHHLLDWPEKDQRKFEWCSLKKAAELLDDPEASALLRSLQSMTQDQIMGFFEDTPEDVPASPPPSIVRALANMVGL